MNLLYFLKNVTQTTSGDCRHWWRRPRPKVGVAVRFVTAFASLEKFGVALQKQITQNTEIIKDCSFLMLVLKITQKFIQLLLTFADTSLEKLSEYINKFLMNMGPWDTSKLN